VFPQNIASISSLGKKRRNPARRVARERQEWHEIANKKQTWVTRADQKPSDKVDGTFKRQNQFV